MRRTASCTVLVALLLLEACLNTNQNTNTGQSHVLNKALFNSEWKNQGVGSDIWYYRLTVIEAPANTKALALADGNWLHPEAIRFEITKDLLIGWRSHASVLNADHELDGDISRHYRGAPIVAYAITDHFDLVDDHKDRMRSWFDREFITVDWTRNLVSQLKRSDSDEGISSDRIDSKTTHLVDSSWVGNPKRIRIGDDFIEFTTRHPVSVSSDAALGAYGLPFKEDTAAPVIDIRHSLMKKKDSDFVPLPYPDEAMAFDENGHRQSVAINNRFGLFRTNLDGRPVYNERTGSLLGQGIVNATIFNIWQKSRDGDGNIIPIEERVPKPIIYYTNVLHPEDLIKTSFRVAEQWDRAFRNAVFYAQPGKYSTVDDVPRMWILRRNNCNLENVIAWLTDKRLDLKDRVEVAAHATLDKVSERLERAFNDHLEIAFSERFLLEISAKRDLEQICSALEFYTEGDEEAFVYQRPGDLRFNLLNLEVENNTTDWSGYGPMFADPLTGETMSATANINLKYIDYRAQQISKQVGWIKDKFPGLKAVYGSGTLRENTVSESALATVRDRVNELKHDSMTITERTSYPLATFKQPPDRGMTFLDNEEIQKTQADLIRSVNSEHPSSRRNSLMDPVRFVDDISAGVAIKYAHLSEQKRFLKIREMVYESVALHELGHNVGLRHNMAASSDALNYGKNYWLIEQMPTDLHEAQTVISDPELIKQLTECISENADMASTPYSMFGRKKITTQDCLQQKNGMYASIMDYHASSVASIKGLGLYDLAAIKWAYAQVVEVFPKENLVIDPKRAELSSWLKHNDYRRVPKDMLKNVSAINQREHVKYTWNGNNTHLEFPKNAVPYAYCEDPTGQGGPRCLAFDFGPDMQSSARWLKARYWQQFLLNNFARDSSWSTDVATLPKAALDIEILDRFTNMLRWYYRNLEDDPEFLGSYAEKDYLKAMAMGMNHFAHVIGLPESGAHISAPMWAIENQQSMATNVNRLSAAGFLVPFNSLSECGAKSITHISADGQINGRFQYRYLDIPLGAGRPLTPGFTGDLEEQFMLYHGSLLVKKYALRLLMAPLSFSGSSKNLEHNEGLPITWYRMFPEAVGKIYAAVITKSYQQLGPLVNDDGLVVARDIIDERTLKNIDDSNQISVMPAMDDSLAFFAASTSLDVVPNAVNQEADLLKTMKISCRGCGDEVDYEDVGAGVRVVSFVHLSNEEYKALKVPHVASIGADLLVEANRQKQRYLRLDECLGSEQARENDPFCQCVKTSDRKTYDEWRCCDEFNQDCQGPELEAVGNGLCSIEDLMRRKEQSKDQLDQIVGFIDNLRTLMKQAGM